VPWPGWRSSTPRSSTPRRTGRGSGNAVGRTACTPTPPPRSPGSAPCPSRTCCCPTCASTWPGGSLRPAEGGWTWKFDPHFSGNRLRLRDLLPQLRCPVVLLRCDRGLVDPAMAADMARLVPAGMPVVDLPDAGHHPMLDQPLALVAALRTLLAVWPRRPR
jgi:pimeloyl-ACP methyl ester carboxylesterase